MKTIPHYYGVIGNRDYIKYEGEKRPFWEFLDVLPEGWLTSLAYMRKDLPQGDAARRMIFDCGAWSYKASDDTSPKLGRFLVTPRWALEQYVNVARPDDFVIAPDHMLIPGLGDLAARRLFNLASATGFLDIAKDTGFVPMAVVHGDTLAERVETAARLVDSGYTALSLGGLAGQASRKKMAVEAVQTMRQRFPGVWLHVLGLSSPSYAREWALCGVDSFDGSSHFKQAFTGGTFYTRDGMDMVKHQAGRRGDSASIPLCDCASCLRLRAVGIDTRYYGSNENNMGRAAHNLNMLMQAHRIAMSGGVATGSTPTFHSVTKQGGLDL